MTLISGVCLWWAGMSAFDAMCHAMAAMATGGFGNYDNSIAHFNSVSIEIIIMVTMIMSCLPFVLYIQAARGHFRPFFKDTQVWVFITMLGVAIMCTAYWLEIKDNYSFEDALRFASFNVTSVMTTTGFSSTNYALWGTFPTFILLIVSMIGGCTGSTAGAIKIFRFQVLWEIFKVQIKQLVHPSGVFKMRFNEKPISEGVAGSVLLFFFIYISVFMISTLLLCMANLDWATSASAVASSMAAAGYGLGDIISPAGSYQPLADWVKWVLSALMMMGRLEFLTVLVLFSPSFWRG
jgi:trk system potassium uptake protein TrkH